MATIGTIEWKNNISKSLRGRSVWNKNTKGLVKPNKGSFKKGQTAWNKGIRFLAETKNPMYGKKHTEESKRKITLTKRTRWKTYKIKRGEEHWNWKGGRQRRRKIEMNRGEYKNWRKLVFERDNYTCKICKQKGGKLEADHIKKWSEYPELRFDINNGRTLCKKCHIETKTWGNRKGGKNGQAKR